MTEPVEKVIYVNVPPFWLYSVQFVITCFEIIEKTWRGIYKGKQKERAQRQPVFSRAAALSQKEFVIGQGCRIGGIQQN